MSELIKTMLDNIINDNQAEAQENFNDAVALKVTDAWDAQKVEKEEWQEIIKEGYKLDMNGNKYKIEDL